MIQLKNIKPYPLIEMGLNPQSEVFDTEGGHFHLKKKYLVTAPSGKGKSTLIHFLYGLRHDYKGAIFLKNQNIRQFDAEAWADLRQKTWAIVFQDLRLFLHLTARENILLKHALTSNSENSPSVSELENWADRLGIGAFLDKKCETLSYGQRQRVAILRGLSQPFEMLLLDEPFSHLDRENTQLAADLIAESCERHGAGLIHVSLSDDTLFQYDAKRIL
jgi:ABC-type lipoprotein export system ATPase subunit